MNSFIEYLQSRPPETKTRILVTTIFACLIIGGALWIYSAKTQLQGLTKNDIIPDTSNSILAINKHVNVESIEQRGEQQYIYFKVQNATSDILNFSPPEKISLKINDENLIAAEVKNRQGEPFARKILSDTTAYGVVVFQNFQPETGKLTFDDMYFEQNAATLFKEILEIDFKQLKPVNEIRS